MIQRSIVTFFLLSLFSFSVLAQESLVQHCEEVQYQEQRSLIDQQIKELRIQEEFATDSSQAESIYLQRVNLERLRCTLVRANILCYGLQPDGTLTKEARQAIFDLDTTVCRSL